VCTDRAAADRRSRCGCVRIDAILGLARRLGALEEGQALAGLESADPTLRWATAWALVRYGHADDQALRVLAVDWDQLDELLGRDRVGWPQSQIADLEDPWPVVEALAVGTASAAVAATEIVEGLAERDEASRVRVVGLAKRLAGRPELEVALTSTAKW